MQDWETASGENRADTLCWVLPRTRSGFLTPSDFEWGSQNRPFLQKNDQKKKSTKLLKTNMIFWSIFHWISDGFWSHFWCFFHTFTIRTCNLLNHQNPFLFNEFQWFYSSEKHDFWWFSWSFPLPVLACIFSGKRTPKWIKKATKMEPQIVNKIEFWDCWEFWKKMFFQGFWKEKKSGQNPEKKQRGGTDPSKITRPGGMRGASGEVRRGWRPLRVRRDSDPEFQSQNFQFGISGFGKNFEFGNLSLEF